MPPLTALGLIITFGFFSVPDSTQIVSVAERYTVRLSDTSLDMQPDGGAVINMNFPATPPTISSDGRCVEYSNVFPHIDLVVYRNHAGFEYDWRVAADADPSAIQVSFRGALSQRIGPDGDLILAATGGEVRHRRPFAYQILNGARTPVEARFDLAGDGRVRFKLGAYDQSRPLVIDPALSFVSGIGGSGAWVPGVPPVGYTDEASGMALDANGNISLSGLAYSPDFPLLNPLPISPHYGGGLGFTIAPSFAAKLSPGGQTLLYSTLLTAQSSSPPSITGDGSGNVYVAGSVNAGYGLVKPGGGTAAGTSDDAFIAKLDTNGVLKAAIRFGGSRADAAMSIVLGPDGKLYVTGTTASVDFPVTRGAIHRARSSKQDLFVMKLDPALLNGNQLGNAVLYSTYLGPGDSPFVAADAGGNAYVAASTTSTAWVATPGVFQTVCWDATREPCADVIAMKVNPAGSQFVYTTYLGGAGADTAGGLAIDSSGNAYITGNTRSLDFPTTQGAYVQNFQFYEPTSETAFVVKLSTDASHLIYGTLLAANGAESTGLSGTAISVDSNGNAWVGGWTEMDLLPVQNGIQQTLYNATCYPVEPGGSTPSDEAYCPGAGFLAELNPNGSGVLWATYLGLGNTGGGRASLGPSVTSIIPGPAGTLLVAGTNLGVINAAAMPSRSNSATVVAINLSGTSLNNVSVTNAAGFLTGLPAPGGLAAMFLGGIPSLGTVTAPGLPLPTELAGVTVLIDGVAAPILAVADTTNRLNAAITTQVNFQVPFEIAGQNAESHVVEVQYGGESAFVIPEQAGPGIFTASDGQGIIQHASDNSLVTFQNPVHRGETIIIYASGLGTVVMPVSSGTPALSADPLTDCYQVTTNAGTVLYAGLTPGFPGLYQVNVQIPPGTYVGGAFISLESRACWGIFFPPQNVGQGNQVQIVIAN